MKRILIAFIIFFVTGIGSAFLGVSGDATFIIGGICAFIYLIFFSKKKNSSNTRTDYCDPTTSKCSVITLNSDNNIIAPIVSFPIGKKNNKFPLTLNKIVLGPSCSEKESNQEQLYLMIKQKQIETTEDFEITTSNIRSYRP